MNASNTCLWRPSCFSRNCKRNKLVPSCCASECNCSVVAMMPTMAAVLFWMAASIQFLNSPSTKPNMRSMTERAIWARLEDRPLA